MLADLDQSVEGLEMECTALKKACVACQDDGAKNTVQTIANAFAGLKMTSVERARRWGKTRTGGRRRSWSLMVWFLFAALLLTVDVVGAVFTPVNRAALKAAVGSCNHWPYTCNLTGGCLGETVGGSCPIFAASNDATGHPYGVIGAWDVSAVTNMEKSKFTLFLSLCWPRRLPLWCVVEYIRQLEVRRVTSLTRVVLVFGCGLKREPCCCCLCGGFLFSLLHPSLFLQCFITHLRSIRTCPTGIQVR